MEKAETESAPVFNKDYLVAIPILASIMALSFDVGYFFGCDINYFTIFSFAEHLTFAAEVLPGALVVATFIASFGYSIRSNTTVSKRAKKWVDVLLAALGIPLLAVMIYFGMYFVVGAAIFLLLLTALFSAQFRGRSNVPVPSAVGFILLAGVVFACCAGIDLARTYRKDGAANYTIIADQETKAKLVRSGDRGILFYDQSNRLTLLPWSQIKKIELRFDK